jgi:hypothetical protein
MRLASIGRPIVPVPMNPIFMMELLPAGTQSDGHAVKVERN